MTQIPKYILGHFYFITFIFLQVCMSDFSYKLRDKLRRHYISNSDLPGANTYLYRGSSLIHIDEDIFRHSTTVGILIKGWIFIIEAK